MKIKEVEELVGISGKNIRFYEDCGLLAPGRAGNGYREYGAADVETLKKIKILRSLGVSVERIRGILRGEESLQSGLRAQKDEIARNMDNLEKTASLTQALLDEGAEIDCLNTDLWLDTIRKMSKEGTDFVNFRKVDVHVKKKAGAILGGVLMILLMAWIIAACLWGNSMDPLPKGILALIIIIPAAVIVGVIAVILKRTKEIDKGEEDEAAQY